MKYKLGTLEEFLLEYPLIEGEEGELSSQQRKWINPKKENEYLWESPTGSIEENEKFNLISVWTHSIVNPDVTKYFINKNDVYSYGVVNIGRVMQSALDKLEIFDSKDEWLSRATELGIEIVDDLE